MPPWRDGGHHVQLRIMCSMEYFSRKSEEVRWFAERLDEAVVGVRRWQVAGPLMSGPSKT